MSVPRDHHFVPVFYLKRWANGQGKLFEYSRCRGVLRVKQVGPRATGFQRDLYNFDGVPPDLRACLESEYLQRSDFLASKALEKLLSASRDPWTVEEKSAWSRFLLGFRLRHPDAMLELRAGLDFVWSKSGERTELRYQQMRKANWPATLDDYLSSHHPHAQGMVKLQLIQRALANYPIAKQMNGMIWKVIDLTGSSYSLMTSDFPLESNLAPHSGAVGFVSLPISPHHLFVGVDEMSTLRALNTRKADDIAQEVNRFVVSRARRYVFSIDRSHDRFVENRMSSLIDKTPLFPELTNIDGRLIGD